MEGCPDEQETDCTLSEAEMKRLDDALHKIEIACVRYAKGSADEKHIEQSSK